PSSGVPCRRPSTSEALCPRASGLQTEPARAVQGPQHQRVLDDHVLDARRPQAAGVDYAVVKNTLALRALNDARVPGLEPHLAGPTGLVLGGADPVAAAKVLGDFAREFEKPAIKVGLVDGKAVTPDQVKRLATL